jgi:hypothetical protein
METGNVDLVLSEITADERNEAAEELARYLDAGLHATRLLLAAFLNDLNNECLIRWVSDLPHSRWRPPPPRTCDARALSPSAAFPIDRLELHACQPRHTRPD